ncbi:MAG: carboxypeptidase regulatory-like domain-containing protein [Acidobacteria bacterium]|nr:carboxypeptidase regulatory-like domain-containing protein [Acidobacteriota bacterium]
MKRVAPVLTAASLLLIIAVSKVTTSRAQVPRDRSQQAPLQTQDGELADAIERFASRSTAGLVPTRRRDGMVTLDLRGRFQNVMLAQADPVGGSDIRAACVTSVEEANAFFGRDLRTGEPVYSDAYRQKGSLTDLATRHGMSPAEFLFYKRMIEEYAQRPGAATITIPNSDGAGEDFNDPAAKAPEGGNNAATLGAQRLAVFNFAANIWGAFLDSSQTTVVSSQFNPLQCTSNSAVLGSAGTATINGNFPNAPFNNTWYHIALANKLSNADLNGAASPEINATFNSTVNGNAGRLDAGGTPARFYLGLDNATPANTVNLLVVLLHEMGHGLGFSSFLSGLTVAGATNTTPITITTATPHGLAAGDQIKVEGAVGNTAAKGIFTVTNVGTTTFDLVGSAGNGTYTANSAVIRGITNLGVPGFADLWSRMMFDKIANKLWSAMTPAERSNSTLNNGNLLWDGPNVKQASAGYNFVAGRDAATGRLQLFAPPVFQQGSSVSHYDSACNPNLLMEPVINVGLGTDLDMTRQLMRDIGWYRDQDVNLAADTITNVLPSGGNLVAGANANVTWTNSAGFSKNVSIELSSDGGATFPTSIASNIANNGAFQFVVPNLPTANARFRVREYDFVAALGSSAANVNINGIAVTPTPTPTPTVTPTLTPTPTPGVPTPTVTPVPGFDGGIDRTFANVPGNGDGNVDQKDLFWYDQFGRGLHCPSETPYNEFQRADGNDNGFLDSGDYTVIANTFLGIAPKVAAKGTATRPPNFCFGVPAEADSGDPASEAMRPAIDTFGAERQMSLSSSAGQPGGDVTVYLTLNAAGNERTTSTSIHWDPRVMTIDGTSGLGVNPDVLPGRDGIPGQVIGVNANDIANGHLGLLIDFTGGSGNEPIAAGRRQIVALRFHVLDTAEIGSSSTVELNSMVVPQQTVDTAGEAVDIGEYTSGTVTVSRTAPEVSLSGHVTTPDGIGLRNATVVITDADGVSRSVVTSSFGTFSFEGLTSGLTYIITVESRRYRFAPKLVQPFDSIGDVDLVAMN